MNTHTALTHTHTRTRARTHTRALRASSSEQIRYVVPLLSPHKPSCYPPPPLNRYAAFNTILATHTHTRTHKSPPCLSSEQVRCVLHDSGYTRTHTHAHACTRAPRASSSEQVRCILHDAGCIYTFPWPPAVIALRPVGRRVTGT